MIEDRSTHRGRPQTTLEVATTGFWPGFDPKQNAITSRLLGQSAVKVDDITNADVVVYSVFGSRHLAARGTTVAVSGEPRFSRDNPDFAIDCRHMSRDGHLRLPPWTLAHLRADSDSYQPQPLEDRETRRFANFIFSNPTCATRNAFFEALHQREPVDALGSVHHNRDDHRLADRADRTWHASKYAVLRDYRFTIAFENTELVGYTTEKMTDAWLADSIPIYWGNPAHIVDFPPGSYLSLYEAGSMTRLVEQVLEAHHDPDRYQELRANNPFRTGHAQHVLDRYRTQLVDFVELIRTEAIQRPLRPRATAIFDMAARRLRRTGARAARRHLEL